MSSLAFDKQGKPFKFSRLGRRLAVRVFSNPGGRGSCFPVHDDNGDEVYVDVDADHPEFRRAVKNEPGLYRLDQYDADGNEIEGAPAAYVTIREGSRNANGLGEVDPRDAVILQMAQSNAELAQTNADVTKTAISEFANVMQATALILRAPVTPPPAALPVERKDDDQEDEDDEEDDERDETPPGPWAAFEPMLEMVQPYLPQLGALFYTWIKERVGQNAATSATPPAAAPIPAPVPAPAPAPAAAPSPGPEPVGAAVGSSPHVTAPPPSAPPPAPSSQPSPTVPSAATSEPPTVSAPTAVESPSSAPADAAATIVRNAPPAPTPEQWTHLYTIRARLTPKEAAIAENAISRMSPDLLAQWLADLSAQPIDDAVRTIRSMISKLRPPRGTGRG